MSTPVGKPATKSNVLDYAPRHLREAGGPRRADEDAPQPRRPADDEPLDDNHPENEPYDIPLAPEAPRDEIRAEADRDRDAASDDLDRDNAGDEASDDWDRDEASEDGRAYRIHAHGLGEPQDGRDERSFDDDIEQLAALLVSIRRGEPGEPPASSPRRAAARPPQGPERSSEVYIDGLRVPRSLQPAYMPPPPEPERRGGYGKIIGGVTGACLLAAALAFAMVGNWHSPMRGMAVPLGAAPAHTNAAAVAERPAAPAAERDARLAGAPAPYTVASAAATAAAPPAAATQEAKLTAQPPPARAVPVVRIAPTQAPIQATTQPTWPADTPPSAPPKAAPPAWPAAPQATAPAAPRAAAPAAAPATPPQTPPVPRPHLTMDAEQIKLLLEQGKQFVAVGDLVTARTVLQRVADADVPAGALALAETYDPAVLARQGVRGLQGDLDQARRWYARARELGSDEAGRRLAQLASPN